MRNLLTPFIIFYRSQVCKEVLGAIQKSLDKGEKDLEKIERKIHKYCKKKKLTTKKKKICYYIEPIKRQISKPFSFGKPADRICKQLAKKNPEICQVKKSIKTNTKTDYSKMRVKHLKQVLADRGVACVGCLEKRDYVKKCKETQHMDL